MENINNNKIINRELEINSESMSEDYILDFAVASNAPIQMSFGVESLVVDAVSIRLDRLKNAGNVLFNHDKDEPVGKVLDVYIDGDKLRVKAKFSANSEYFGMIQDGTLTSVSLGYLVHKYEQRDGILYAMDWEPLEVSMVTIPADVSVGIGRSLDEQEIKATPATTVVPEEPKVEERKLDIKITKEELKKMENTLNYRSIGAQYGLSESQISFAERSQLSETQFQNLIIEALQNKAVETRVADVHLNEKEVREYSIANAILSQVKGSGVEAGYEIELSNEIGRLTGRSTNGLYIPAQVLMRDMTALGTSPNKGKDFVGTVTSPNFVDYAWNSTIASRAGVTMMSGLRENLQIPKFTSAASFGWYAENGTISQVDPQTDQVVLSPKRGGASFNYSNQLLKQTNPSIEAYLAKHIQTAVSVGLDNAVFNGTGVAPQPKGILASVTTNTVTGTSLTYAKSLDFAAKVAAANRAGGRMVFVANPTTAAILRSRAKETGFPVYLVEDNKLSGYELIESNQIGASTLLFGDFSYAVMGTWGGIELLVNPFTNGRSYLTEITATVLADVAVLDEKAFTKSTNIS